MQNILYAATVLNALISCICVLAADRKTREDECRKDVAGRFGILCDALWNNRHFVPRIPTCNKTVEDTWKTKDPSLPIVAIVALTEMLKLYNQETRVDSFFHFRLLTIMYLGHFRIKTSSQLEHLTSCCTTGRTITRKRVESRS